MAKPEPKPCRKFPRMPASAKFFAHLRNCTACRAVLEYLQRDLELRNLLHESRNWKAVFARFAPGQRSLKIKPNL